MTVSPRLWTAAILIALAAVGGYLAWGPSATAAPGPGPGPGSQLLAPGEGSGAPEVNLVGGPATASAGTPRRREIGGPTPGANAPDSPQGITGTVVDPAGTPLAGVEVYLIESVANNLMQRYHAAGRGVRFPPTVATLTDDMGQFVLGVGTVADDKTFEVRILDDRFADHTTPDVTILTGDWFDLGRVQLEPGLVVRGRVTLEGSAIPLAGATVSLARANVVELVSIPGREHGIVATTNGAGYFEIRNAPRHAVDLSALADGFARQTRRNLILEQDRVNVADFALAHGTSIAGQVTNGAGQPIAGAQIKAHSLNPKANHTENAITDAHGAFLLRGLHRDKYHLVVSAADYEVWRQGPVEGGAGGVLITLVEKGQALARVFDPDGNLVENYRLWVRQHFAQGNHLGLVRDVSPLRVTARDLVDGAARVRGIDSGSYVFEVQARGFAKSFSAPFELTPGAEAPVVEVTLARGAEIVGRVEDESGSPIAGATIQTQANGTVANSLWLVLGAGAPTKISQAQTRSDLDGRFSLPRMAPGTYQLEFAHPDYCDTLLRDVEVGDQTVLDLPRTALTTGTQVTGIGRFAGMPQGQLKVVITTQVTPAAPGGSQAPAPAPAATVTVEAITDNAGRFQFGKRIPPGTYELKAARQTSGDLFTTVLDFKKSARTLTVARGIPTLQVDIDIPAQ